LAHQIEVPCPRPDDRHQNRHNPTSERLARVLQLTVRRLLGSKAKSQARGPDVPIGDGQSIPHSDVSTKR
jgi:hypothetical protein